MANSSNQIFVKFDPSCKARPYYFTDGMNCLSDNYTKLQANAHIKMVESLGYEVIDLTV